MKKFIYGLLVFIVFLSGCSPRTIEINWSPPPDGGPVDHYVVVLQGDDSPKTFETPATSISLKVNKGETYYAKVGGVSPTGEVGEYSEPSEPVKIN